MIKKQMMIAGKLLKTGDVVYLVSKNRSDVGVVYGFQDEGILKKHWEIGLLNSSRIWRIRFIDSPIIGHILRVDNIIFAKVLDKIRELEKEVRKHEDRSKIN